MVIDGTVTFQAGEELMDAGPGDVVIVPPGVQHEFARGEAGGAKLACIHANPTLGTEWLE